MAVIQEELRLRAPAGTRTDRASTQRLGLWLGLAGWASLTVMWVTGSAEVFGHEQEGLPAIFAIGLFLTGWVVMIAAMMLPSSLPTLRRVDGALAGQGLAAAPRFMGGYFFAWAAFGAAAFAGDGILHQAVDRMSWLGERPELIAGGVAVFAGAAELLGRTPPRILPSIASGRDAFSAGKTHAVERIRRCWPLMLFAMAIGMSSPIWMVGLTVLMVLQLLPRASTVLRLAGLTLLVMGAAVIIEPAWLPVLMGG